jgi:multiple sugar transport system ATP-binding protein
MTLILRHLAKTFPGGVRAVDDLSLEVAAGEVLVLVGPSGCGKTTVLRMIAGLEPPSQGSIALEGRVLDGLPPRHRDVAMVFQHGALYPHLSVYGNMAFSLALRRTAKAEIRRRVRAAAATLGIEDLLDRRPGQLSGGQRQRVALGRALVRQPKLFLFDEPLSNLEASLRSQLQAEIRRLHALSGATAVYVTHDQTEAMTLGQRVAVLRQGRLQQVADPLTLYRRPANRFVAALIGMPPMNFLAGRIQRHDGGLGFVVEEDPGAAAPVVLPIPAARAAALTAHVGGPVLLGLRPEHLFAAGPEPSPGAARLPATVEAIERLGPVSHVALGVGRQTLIARMDAACKLAAGEPVLLAAAMDEAHFFDAVSEQAIAA